MAQVQMQVYRGTSDYLDTISNVDGQVLYDEDTHQILLDNGTTREQYGGGNEKVYDTYAEAVADLANIAEGQTVFVKEGSSNELAQRVNDLETDLGDKATASAVSGDDAFAKINTLNTHLSNLEPTDVSDEIHGVSIASTVYGKKQGDRIDFSITTQPLNISANGAVVIDALRGYTVKTTALAVFKGSNTTPPVDALMDTNGTIIIRSSTAVTNGAYIISGSVYVD